MGLTFFKGIKAGPFRFNLSGSGLGISTGVKGFRIGTGPRGTYVSIGAGGFRYRTYLNSSSIRSRATLNSASPPRFPSERAVEPVNSVQMTEIVSADALLLHDESTADFLKELNERGSKISLVTVTQVIAILTAFSLAAWWYNQPESMGPKVVTALAVIFYVMGIVYAYFADLRRLQTVLMFDASDAFQSCYQQVLNAFQSASTCSKVSHIRAQGFVSLQDRKYHAGATRELDVRDLGILFRCPARIKANVNPACLMAGKDELYFFPDRLLVKSENRFGAVSFDSIHIEAGTAKMIVDSAPVDAPVVGRTWRYVNKNGGPDKRFKANRELPIVEFSTLLLRSNQGLNELFYFSRPGSAEVVKDSIENFGKEINSISIQKPSEKNSVPSSSAVKPPPFKELISVAEAKAVTQPTLSNDNTQPKAVETQSSEQYYLGLNGMNYGLYARSEIQEWIKSQRIESGTLFWDDQTQQWLDMSQFPS